MNTAEAILSSKEKLKCFGCSRDIQIGSPYVKNGSINICPECGFLMTKKTGQSTLRENEFSDIMIPNCLRKIRDYFRKDPTKAIAESGLNIPDNVNEIGVEDHSRSIHFIRRGLYDISHFVPGNMIDVFDSVKRRKVRIMGCWVVSGSSLGLSYTCIGILVH